MIPSTLIYVRREGKTLMLRKARGHQRGKWNGLGGKAEPGEMPETCARREVLEESGLVVDTLDYRGLIVFPRFDGTNDWYVWIYLATAHGEPVASSEGELAWIDDTAVGELEIHEGDRHFLPWLDLVGTTFSARFLYRDGRYEGHDVIFHRHAS
jgi:8-oxo-dGTP diphosphatase